MYRLRAIHLFAGAGGGLLGDILLNHHPIAAVEINEYCQQVLSQRQKDGLLPWFPIFSDVTKFDGTKFKGLAEIICGGFPCQDISVAGKGIGIVGKKSGLWKEMSRIVSEVQPRFAFVENSPLLRSRGLWTVLKDFTEMGYCAEWGIVSAADAGALHKRDRMWIRAERKV